MTDEQYVYTSLYDVDNDGETCEVLYVPTVCIIESPSPADRIVGRQEGLAISDALKIANIRHKLFDVTDFDSFLNALKGISEYAATKQSRHLIDGKRKVAVTRLFIHCSCHGNENGIGLTNGDFIEWNELGRRFLALASRLGLYDRADGSFANLLIGMSSCRGLHARQMATDPDACPFVSLVGCKGDVLWTDAIAAFNIFYHQAITKGRTIPKTIQAINDASLAPDVFELVTAKDVGARGFLESPIVVLMCAGRNGKLRWSYDTRIGRGHIPATWPKDQVCDPASKVPILDSITGQQLPYFDEPEDAIRYMRSNPGRYCQVERCAAQEINIRFAHRY